ncbi:uncharacterized protein LOC135474892 [Liolophura sinensis]|uniref:uncharacterized protein LOC135474892 n=1 Tax=Liolophura sinensis TaxID=3198878 RepID=UPI0031584A57
MTLFTSQLTLSAMLVSATCLWVKNVSGYTDFRQNCPATIAPGSILKVYRGQCYEFVRVERYWDVARRDCQGRGGDLVQIRDPETQKFAIDTLAKLRWNKNGLWLGAHDRHKEGLWKWVTGEKITWSNWEAGQPSCYVPALKVFCAEDCAVLRLNTGKWHDYRCHASGFTYTYICQYDMLTTTAASLARNESSVLPETIRIMRNNDSGITPATNISEASTNFTEDVTDSDLDNVTVKINVSMATGDNETKESSNVPQKAGKSTENEENVTALDRGNDFIEVHTVFPVEESTLIVLGENDVMSNDYYKDYDDALHSEVKSAQTGSHSKEDTSKSLIGPIVGVLMGACVFAALLVMAVFLYRKRSKPGGDSWVVGFDNPNYANTVLPETRQDRNVAEVVYEESSRVAMFPPEEKGACGTTCAEDMCTPYPQPDVCSVAARKPAENHYVSFDFQDGCPPPESHSHDQHGGNHTQTSPKETS